MGFTKPGCALISNIMAILKIARMGHSVLRMPAAPVANPTAPEIRRLVRDMIETMYDAGGTGLAAPQVHVSLRVVVFMVTDERAAADHTTDDHSTAVPLTVLINPEIAPLSGEMAEDWEGCLSIPGLTGLVPRHTAIRYGGVGLDGELVEREAHGFHARVVQHECDHLDGILYPQRMTDLSSLSFTEELAAAASQQQGRVTAHAVCGAAAQPEGNVAAQFAPASAQPKEPA